jgi:hypothetical protein
MENGKYVLIVLTAEMAVRIRNFSARNRFVRRSCLSLAHNLVVDVGMAAIGRIIIDEDRRSARSVEPIANPKRLRLHNSDRRSRQLRRCKPEVRRSRGDRR